MHAMPSVTPLAWTASLTSSVLSRTASPPAVRSSVSRWETFTAPILTVPWSRVQMGTVILARGLRGGLAGRAVHLVVAGRRPTSGRPAAAPTAAGQDEGDGEEGQETSHLRLGTGADAVRIARYGCSPAGPVAQLVRAADS